MSKEMSKDSKEHLDTTLATSNPIPSTICHNCGLIKYTYEPQCHIYSNDTQLQLMKFSSLLFIYPGGIGFHIFLSESSTLPILTLFKLTQCSAAGHLSGLTHLMTWRHDPPPKPGVSTTWTKHVYVSISNLDRELIECHAVET